MLVGEHNLLVISNTQIEKAIKSVIKEAFNSINTSYFIIGEVRSFAFSTVPTKWLECNGASLLRADYPDLYSAIGTAFGTADGTHFNIPDLRGKFIRGWDHAAANDPDAASRTAQATGGATGDNVGSVQADAFRAHRHTYDKNWQNAVAGDYAFGCANPNINSQNTGLTGGNETRPININLLFCIYAGV